MGTGFLLWDENALGGVSRQPGRAMAKPSRAATKIIWQMKNRSSSACRQSRTCALGQKDGVSGSFSCRVPDYIIVQSTCVLTRKPFHICQLEWYLFLAVRRVGKYYLHICLKIISKTFNNSVFSLSPSHYLLTSICSLYKQKNFKYLPTPPPPQQA